MQTCSKCHQQSPDTASECENCKADLIVMGTRGLGAVKGILVGSVSRKVIDFASCPVMVAH